MPVDQGASSDLIFTKDPDMSTFQVTPSKMKNSGSGPKNATSPMPVDFRYASARFAMPRGQRLYGLPSAGSMTSHVMLSTASSVNGSIRAVRGSGMSSMSDAWMPFQPAIEEPSNAWPSSNLSLVKCLTGTETCCSLPRVSVKRRSTNFASLSLAIFKASSAVISIFSSPEWVTERNKVGYAQQNPCHGHFTARTLI